MGKYVVTRPLDAEGKTFVKWDLSDAYVSEYLVAGVSEPGVEPMTAFSISFAKAERTQVNVKADGKSLETPVVADWSLLAREATKTAGFGFTTLDKPTLELTLNDGGKASDVSLDSFSWSGQRDESGAVPELFNVLAPLGVHSSGLFSAVAGTRLIDSVSIKRHQAINGTKVELYRFDLSSVVLTDYTTTGSNTTSSEDPEFFTINPRKVKLTTFEYDKIGKQTSSSFFEWDTRDNKTDGNNIGNLGNQPSANVNTENKLRFGDGSAIDLDSFDWNAELPVALPSQFGQRKVGQSSADDFVFVWQGAPLTSHLQAFVEGKTAVTPVEIDTSILDSSMGKLVNYANWDLNGKIGFNSFEFIDSKQAHIPFNSFSINFDEADLQLNQFSNDGTSKVTNKTSVDCNLPTQSVTNAGDFGSFQFDPLSFPKSTLEVKSAPNSPELKVLAYVWETSNPVEQQVGLGKLSDRQGGGRTEFAVLTEYSETSAGFITSLAQGSLIDELKLTSWDFTTKEPRPFREWDFSDVFISSYSVRPADGNGRGIVSLTLDIGRVVSTITTYEDSLGSALAFLSVGPAAPALETTIATTFTSFVDFVSPPASTGIPNVQATDLDTTTVALPNFFSDEQELAVDLTYSYNIDTNPGLFNNVSIDANKQLILQPVANQPGTATITVTATDAFGLIASTTFDVTVNNTPPVVTAIIAGSSTWLGPFIDAVDGSGTGAGNGLGYELVPSQTIASTGVDRIYIQFSESVNQFNASNVVLFGANVLDYATIATVSYDATNNRGIISLASPLASDKLRIGVSNLVADVAGGTLGGGVLDFSFNVLVGDADDDGNVNGGDLSAFAGAFNQSAGGANYNPRADWNADGEVNGADLTFFATQFNQSLPASNPPPLDFGPSTLSSRRLAAPPVDKYFSGFDDERLTLLDAIDSII